jgi:hypothetical protein
MQHLALHPGGSSPLHVTLKVPGFRWQKANLAVIPHVP